MDQDQVHAGVHEKGVPCFVNILITGDIARYNLIGVVMYIYIDHNKTNIDSNEWPFSVKWAAKRYMYSLFQWHCVHFAYCIN